jgi:hypothetical protein
LLNDEKTLEVARSVELGSSKRTFTIELRKPNVLFSPAGAPRGAADDTQDKGEFDSLHDHSLTRCTAIIEAAVAFSHQPKHQS